MTEPLPCFKCDRVLDHAIGSVDTASRSIENIIESAPNQVSNGMFFTSHGAYGATVFDPMDHTYLEIVICDECIKTYSVENKIHRVDDRNKFQSHKFFDHKSLY